MESETSNNWLPIESNPDVINDYMEEIGFNYIRIEDWAQDLIPQPVKALLLVYPIKTNTIETDKLQFEKIQKEGQKLFYILQNQRNACGTIGLFHALVNLLTEDESLVKENSFLFKFYQKIKGKTPEEATKILEEISELENVHRTVAEKGVSEINEDVNTHFVCFVVVEKCLYELDGRKKIPINHGACEPEELLNKGCNVIQKNFLDRDVEEIKFTVLALTKTEQSTE